MYQLHIGWAQSSKIAEAQEKMEDEELWRMVRLPALSQSIASSVRHLCRNFVTFARINSYELPNLDSALRLWHRTDRTVGHLTV